jgi:hypothetical protein
MTPLSDLSEAVARIVDRLGIPEPTRIPSRAELVDQALSAARAAFTADDPPAAVRKGLRRVKYPLVATLIRRDHEEGLSSLEVVTATLSNLTAALVEAPLLFARARLEMRHGAPPDGWATLRRLRHGQARRGGAELQLGHRPRVRGPTVILRTGPATRSRTGPATRSAIKVRRFWCQDATVRPWMKGVAGTGLTLLPGAHTGAR